VVRDITESADAPRSDLNFWVCYTSVTVMQQRMEKTHNKKFAAGSKKELIVIETSKKNRFWEDIEILTGNIFVHVSSYENYPRKIDFINHVEDKGMKD
jgi:hypothetical protein